MSGAEKGGSQKKVRDGTGVLFGENKNLMVGNCHWSDGQGMSSHSFCEKIWGECVRKGPPPQGRGPGISARIGLHKNIPFVGGNHDVAERGDLKGPGIKNESRGVDVSVKFLVGRNG